MVANNGRRKPKHRRSPGPHTPDGFVEEWILVRTVLQPIALVAEGHEGLHLVVQALLVTGDLVAALWTKHH